MSYILDALLKADLERQRRGVPGLHTLPVPSELQPAGRQRHLLWAGGLGVVAVCAALAAGRACTPAALRPAEPVHAKPAVPELAVAVPPEPEPVLGPVLAPALVLAAPPKQMADPLPAIEPRREGPAPERRPGARLYDIAELPPALQQEARRITVAGFAQSDDATERMAVIDDRARREGEEVRGGLRVERISGDGVVFNFRGYRFRKGAP
ncbi:MAG: hypothetical protein H6R10_2704 [Rhodocyclaceae bacterium]|nr:hypothetical protein [Rhodocyclaceae bacterium]